MNSAAIGQLLPLAILILAFWFLVIRPARNRQRQATQTQSSLRPGQQVMTTAGMYATVSDVEDDAVVLEISPGVTSRYAKAAVARIIEPSDSDTETGSTDAPSGTDKS